MCILTQGTYPVCHFSCSYISKRVLIIELIQIYVFISPYELWQTQKVNSTQEQERLRKCGKSLQAQEVQSQETLK